MSVPLFVFRKASTRQIMTFINSVNEASIKWLANVLKTEVSGLRLRENMAFNSSVAHLEVEYETDKILPKHLLIKVNTDHNGQNEIQFYRFAKDMRLTMIPNVIGMGYEPDSGLSFLLLEDLSGTHRSPVSREQLITSNGIPSQVHLEAAVDVIAEFHARFWEHPRFGTIPDTTEMRWWYRDEDTHKKHVKRRSDEWAKFVDLYASEIPHEWLKLGESALKALPKLFETRIKPRLGPMRRLTMSQGDCYLTQFLVPQTGSGRTYLIDFQDVSVNFPTYDLVYMFATFWSREHRNQNEKKLLKRYQRGLEKLGIEYEWNILQDDYRLCISYMIFDAIWNAASGSSKRYWFPKFQCLVNAYEDWDCASL